MDTLVKTAEPHHGSHFVLKRLDGDGERQRFDAQHLTIVQSSGLLFHPSLGNLSQFKSILDCAAGSSVWVKDLLLGGNEYAKNQPVKLSEGTVVDLCDINAKYNPDSLPKGVNSFFERDITKPFGQDKRNKYDLINGHFFLGWVGTPPDAWGTVLSHLKDCLKPGGYLNLREVSTRWDNPGPATFFRRLEDLVGKLWEYTGHHTRVGLSAAAHLQGKEGVPSLEAAKRIADGALKEVETVGAIYRSILVAGKKPN